MYLTLSKIVPKEIKHPMVIGIREYSPWQTQAIRPSDHGVAFKYVRMLKKWVLVFKYANFKGIFNDISPERDDNNIEAYIIGYKSILKKYLDARRTRNQLESLRTRRYYYAPTGDTTTTTTVWTTQFSGTGDSSGTYRER